MEITLATLVACCVLHNIAIMTNVEEPTVVEKFPVSQEIEVEPERVKHNYNGNTDAVRIAL